MRYAAYLAFFLSGASSLIFQMIWSRLLHHVFGSSSIAISSVVSVFMGGLALGAWLFGRVSDRIRRPLHVYALAEIGVGLCGLAVPLLVQPDGWLADVNGLLRAELGNDSILFMIARFVCIVPILIVPTTLMGATLPLLARFFVQSNQDAATASTRVGALYSINTLGAVVGVFLAGFVLMPRFGVQVSNLCAVSLNFGLSALILVVFGRSQVSIVEPSSEPRPAAPATGARLRWVAAAVFGCSGLVSLMYEVVWVRALINAIGGSVYSFALVLITFLIGISGGSGLASAILGGERTAVRGITIASAALCLLAALPMGVRNGGWGWLMAGLAGVFVVVGIHQLISRQHGDALMQRLEPLTGQLTQLVTPVAVSIIALISQPGRIEKIALTVVGLLALLMALLRVLRERPALSLVATQLYIAVATFSSDIWLDEISLAFAAMVAPLYDRLPDSVNLVLSLMGATASLCVLPSALAMGAMFPLTMRLWSTGGAHVGREVGLVYTGNTVGSIVGAWLPGFLLMPTLGMQTTLHLGIGLNLLLALALLLAMEPGRGWLPVRALSFAVPLAIALLFVVATRPGSFITWNLSKMTLGAFRISLARDVLDEETWGQPDLVYYRDGLSTTVSVERWGRHYSLKNNGKVDASNGDDMPTQIMAAAVPLLFHRDGPTDLDVMVVGVGSGVTVGAALQFPIASLDAVELERSVIQASRFFEDVNHLDYLTTEFPYASAPRLRIHNDDGRNFLAASTRDYDVIISEPSNPWLTGVSDLFTADHFVISKRKLREGGIYGQWVQLYEMSPRNVKTIYRTFASHFKHVMVFSAEDLSSDTLLIGSDAPLPMSLDRLQRAMAFPSVSNELERAYVHSPFDVMARVLLSSRQEVMRYTQLEYQRTGPDWVLTLGATNATACPAESCRREPAPINRDDNALIEFAAPRDLISYERYSGYLGTIYAADWPFGKLSGRLAGFGEGAAAAHNHGRLAMSLLAHGRKREAAVFARRAAAVTREGSAGLAEDLLRMLLGKREPDPRPGEPSLDTIQSARMRGRLRRALVEARASMGRGDFSGALDVLDELPPSLRAQAGSAFGFLHGYLLYKNDHHDDAIEAFEELARGDEAYLLAHPQLYYYLARCHDASLHFDKAVRNMRVYAESLKFRPPVPPIAEPLASEAPTTDAPGVTPKDLRVDRSIREG